MNRYLIRQTRSFSILRPSLAEKLIRNVPTIADGSAAGWQVPSRVPELESTRIVPKLKTFYAANPIHEQNMRELESLLRKYSGAVISGKSEKRDYRWLSMEEYRLTGCGTRLRASQYSKLIQILQQLDYVDPQLVDLKFTKILDQYRRPVTTGTEGKSKPQLDEYGRAVATGGRKTSKAKVYLVRGEGEMLVNGEPLSKMFPRLTDRNSVLYPLKVVDSEGKYNVFAQCSGGGVSGQAGAVANAIAKALVIFNPLLKTRLHKADCITRDQRTVERKKPGKVKSRKSPTWVKR